MPFVEVTLSHQQKIIVLNNVLVDTGSASTIFDVGELAKINLLPEDNDPIHIISGVGGSEFVIWKKIDIIQIGLPSHSQIFLRNRRISANTGLTIRFLPFWIFFYFLRDPWGEFEIFFLLKS